jgi:sterol desaturase/sphingolipid hydroxylase (fatty acid hydroxylase superfamily)
VPFLWAFHKTHHTAEALTPLTNYRLHAVDAVKFANILALFIGAASGGLDYLLGPGVGAFTFSDRNLIGLVFVLLVLHLQHSHIWLAATGVWGRIFLSPAHHQIHHSTNPSDFNKNFGSFLSIWDWMFGTLRIPAQTRERLNFGVAPIAEAQHSITGCLITPFAEAVEPWLGGETPLTEGLKLE